ncbi:hypothetical protein LTR95_001858, partial [Oleoguttula sp. CCFEE 5521]
KAAEGVINLPDDDPDAVQVMLEFFYNGNFLDSDDAWGSGSNQAYIDLYYLAEKYMLPRLQARALKDIPFRLPGSEEAFMSLIQDAWWRRATASLYLPRCRKLPEDLRYHWSGVRWTRFRAGSS